MSQISNHLLQDLAARHRERSDDLMRLLAHCPEHLFSTDDDELAPVVVPQSDESRPRESRLSRALRLTD